MNGPVSKAGDVSDPHVRGFESLSLREIPRSASTFVVRVGGVTLAV